MALTNPPRPTAQGLPCDSAQSKQQEMPFSSTHISFDTGYFKLRQDCFYPGSVRGFGTPVSIHRPLGSFYSHRSCQTHQKVNLKLNQQLQGSTSMLLPAVICFPQCSSHSPGCQQAFRLPDIQLDPGQLCFVLVYSVLSRCLMDFSPPVLIITTL